MEGWRRIRLVRIISSDVVKGWISAKDPRPYLTRIMWDLRSAVGRSWIHRTRLERFSGLGEDTQA